MSEIKKGLLIGTTNTIKVYGDDISSNINLNLGSGSIDHPIQFSHLTDHGEEKAVTIKNGLFGIDVSNNGPKAKLHIGKEYFGKESIRRSTTAASTNNPASIINTHTCHAADDDHNYYKIAQLTAQDTTCYGGLNIKGTIIGDTFGVSGAEFTENFMRFDITIMAVAPQINLKSHSITSSISGTTTYSQGIDSIFSLVTWDFTNNIAVSPSNESAKVALVGEYDSSVFQVTSATITDIGSGYAIGDTCILKQDSNGQYPVNDITGASTTGIKVTLTADDFTTTPIIGEPQMYMIGTVNGSAMVIDDTTNDLCKENDIIVSTNTSQVSPYPKAVVLCLKKNNICNIEITSTGYTNNDIDCFIIDYDGIRKPTNIKEAYGEWQGDNILRLSDPAKNDIIYNTPNGVGIGTNVPKSKLDVEGGVAIGSTYSGTHAAPTDGLLVEGNVGIGTNDPGTKLDVRLETATATTSSTASFGLAKNVAGNSIVTISNDWNGTASTKDGDAVLSLTPFKKEDNIVQGRNSYIAAVPTTYTGTENDKMADIIFKFRTGGNNDYVNAHEKMRIRSDGHVGIGTNDPKTTLEIDGTDALRIPVGTFGQRNFTLLDGQIRYNTTNSQFEGYAGSNWETLNGVSNYIGNTKIISSYPDADSTNNDLIFYTSLTDYISGPLYIASDGTAGAGWVQGHLEASAADYPNGLAGNIQSGQQNRDTTTSGNGSGAKLTIDTGSGSGTSGSIISVTVNNAGTGYEVGDTLTVPKVSISGREEDLIFILTANNINATPTPNGPAVERMRIDPTGNVGIGTDSPSKKLEVSNDALISTLTVGRGKYEFAENTAFGYQALESVGGMNHLTKYNTAIGYQALKSLVGNNILSSGLAPAEHNTAIGYKALLSSNSSVSGATYNTAVGSQALQTNVVGKKNTAIGKGSLYTNKSSYNTAVGMDSLSANDSGELNTAIGLSSLVNNINGQQNTAIGYLAGHYSTGDGTTTGNKNTFLGTSTHVIYDSTTQIEVNYSTAVGYNAEVTKNNQIVLGGDAGSSSYPEVYIPGNVGIGTTSPQSKLDVEGGVRIGSTYSGNTTITTDPANGMIVEGNVGIGTNDPEGLLHISSAQDAILKITGDNTDTDHTKHPYLIFQQDGLYNEAGVFLGNGVVTDDTGAVSDATTNDLIISTSTYSGGNIHFKTDNTSSIGAVDISNLIYAPTRMTILANGNVGIGTNTPTSELEVVGTITAPNYLINDIYGFTGFDGIVKGMYGLFHSTNTNLSTTPSTSDGLNIGTNDYNGRIGMSIVNDLDTDLHPNASVQFHTHEHGVTWRTPMTIKYTGNVGIGTNSPNVILDINGTDALRLPVGTVSQRPIAAGVPDITTINKYIGSIRYNSDNSQFEGYGPGNAWGSLGGVINVAQNTKIIASWPDADSTNNDLMFFTAPVDNESTNAAAERMRIDASGNVGIGTSTPSEKLRVHGDIYSSNLTGQGTIGLGTIGNEQGSYITWNISNNGLTEFTNNKGTGEGGFKFYNKAGDVSISDATNLLVIMNDTGVGIGTTAPAHKLHVVGDTRLEGKTYIGAGPSWTDEAYIQFIRPTTSDVSNNTHLDDGFHTDKGDLSEISELQFVVTDGGGAATVDDIGFYPSGEVNCSKKLNALSFNATSDIRHKENIVELENSLEKITSLRAVNYNFKETPNSKAAGLIAQEVDKIIPEAISKRKADKWTLDYNSITGYLVGCIKELKEENDTLKEDLKRKGDTIDKLHHDVSEIKEMLNIRH